MWPSPVPSVNEPAILLGDEPTGNLDSQTSREVIALFRELNEKSGITIILVTHNQQIARDAKRTVVMRDGRIVCDTTDFRLAAEALREDLDEYDRRGLAATAWRLQAERPPNCDLTHFRRDHPIRPDSPIDSPVRRYRRPPSAP